MKRFKQIFNEAKLQTGDPDKDITEMLWNLIYYSPKVPVRFQQQQLLDEAKHFSLEVYDAVFTQQNLTFNGFIWGNGKRKVLVTHGWGAKAIDFNEMITEMRKIDDLQIIAFDAPGNGSSISDLSNLVLYSRAIEAIMTAYGEPEIMISHSLGAIANVYSLTQNNAKPKLMISIAPIIRLKENFAGIMDSVGASKKAQDRFFENFIVHFHVPLDIINWVQLYNLDESTMHWVAYNPDDALTPYAYIEEFIEAFPFVKATPFDIAHEKMHKDEVIIAEIIKLVKGE